MILDWLKNYSKKCQLKFSKGLQEEISSNKVEHERFDELKVIIIRY